MRADLARALLLAGEIDKARQHARIIDRADPAEKQRALAGSEEENSLASLHIELGDYDEAARDARRLMLGSPTEKVQGGLALATLDLLHGGFASGADRLAAAADLAMSSGVRTVATTLRWKAIWAAYHSGDLARARAQVNKLPADAWKPAQEVLLALIDARAAPPGERAHGFAHARAAVDDLPRGILKLQLGEVLAHARGDWSEVVSLHEELMTAVRVRGLTTLYLASDARAQLGELREAADGFAQLVADPQAWKEPVLTGRAWRRLGDVRAALGDRDGAIKAYQTLIARWTLAPAVDLDLASAKSALERLNSSASDATLPPQ